MGHYLAARQRGLDVGLPTFIPFVGAWIELKQKPHNVETEAYVGLAGPLVGTLGALACYFIGRELNSQLWLAIAYAGFILKPVQSHSGVTAGWRAHHRRAFCRASGSPDCRS